MKRTHLKLAISIITVGFSLALTSPSLSAGSKKNNKPVVTPSTVQVHQTEILERSQISYLSDGGFTGVRSYGVIISCVKGKVSVLKTIHDPHHHSKPIRQTVRLRQEDYLKLWKRLQKQNVFQTKNVPDPKLDIFDEFTVEFEARVGNKENRFKVYGIRRPEASNCFAVKTLIDQTVRMNEFLENPSQIAYK